MPNTLFRRHRHTLLYVLLGVSVHHAGRHNFLNLRGPRSTSLENDLPGIVSLGDETDQLRALHNHKRADLFVRHELHGVVNGRGRGDGPDILTLDRQYILHSLHWRPPHPSGLALPRATVPYV